MKNYILKNIKPLLIGFVAGIFLIHFLILVSDTIVKIAIIQNK